MSKYKLDQEVFFNMCGTLGKGTVYTVYTEESKEKTLYRYKIVNVYWWSRGLKDFDRYQRADVADDLAERYVFSTKEEAEESVAIDELQNALSSVKIEMIETSTRASVIRADMEKLPELEARLEKLESRKQELEKELSEQEKKDGKN